MSARPRPLRDPRVAAAVLAVLVRGAVAWQVEAHGRPAPALDGAYYLDWAGDIARGDWLGRAGTIRGEAFLFNPLYAYVIAPVVAVFGNSPGAVVALQAILAGATAALAAAAARRFAGTVAAWMSGICVALSTALVHLDGKIAVSGLAAFLVAGAVWSLSPEEDGVPPRRGHGPFAAGVWLGLSLLARPVTLPATLGAAWLVARRSARPWRAAALLALPVAVCAGLSFARNAVVAGEPVVFTAANGQNLHLGDNPAARRTQSMATDEFRFGPLVMHDDAKFRVGYELRHEPSRAEISSWFTARALQDFAEAPGASLAWYGTKLRWFAGPLELASSDVIQTDTAQAPLLGLAFVRTWLLVALAASAVVVARRRAELLLGPGAIVASHALACTLVYPLSHYRSPAIPAMAVMAGVAAAEIAALRADRARHALVALLVGASVAVAGALPPQAPTFAEAAVADEAAAAYARGDDAAADELARQSLAASPDDILSLTVQLKVATRQGRLEDARAAAAHIVRLRPWDPDALTDVAWSDARLGKTADALREVDAVVALYPWSGKVHGGRGAIRLFTGDVVGGREDLRFALDHGFRPPPWALEKAGL
jgi:hypothetical protein